MSFLKVYVYKKENLKKTTSQHAFFSVLPKELLQKKDFEKSIHIFIDTYVNIFNPNVVKLII